jgi:hypothetical protein
MESLIMNGQISSRLRSVRLLSMVFTMAVIFCCVFPTLLAEVPTPSQPAPSPHTSIQHTPSLQFDGSGSFSAQVARFGLKARELMKGLQTEMMSLMGWVEYLALILMTVVIIGSGLREWHENNWEGPNLFWWFGRLGVCLLLFGASLGIIDELYLAGKEIAEGGNHDSMLFKFYADRETLFNAGYEKVVDGSFKVTVSGQEFKVEPIDGAEAFLGVTHDQEGAIRDITSKLDDSSFTLPRLFAILSIARGVMELGDVWLVVLAGLLMMTFKVTAPFMVVLGIDRKLSQRTVNTYLWGLIVLTLIWPSVSYFIRGLAYMAGDLAMSMGDQGQVYDYDDAAQKTLRFPDTQPVYTIGFGALMMLGSGLALWVSPFLAYSFSMGRVFESVSQTASQYAASFAGAAMEWVSANVAAKISRQAERIQIQGGNEAEQERARGEKRAADLGAQARLAQAVQGARAQQITSLSQVHASLANQSGMANAGRDFQNMSLYRQSLLNYRNMMTAREKEIADNSVAKNQQVDELKAGWRSNGIEISGRSLSGAAPPLWGPSNKSAGANTIGGAIKGPVSRIDPIGAAGFTAGSALQHYGNYLGWQLREEAVNNGAQGRENNISNYYSDMNKNLRAYSNEMNGANADFAKAQAAVANASAAQASKGVNEGYALQLNTAHRVYDLETEANQTRLDAQINAAGVNLRSGLQAANLRAMSHVITQVAGKITRDIEKSVEMRF